MKRLILESRITPFYVRVLKLLNKKLGEGEDAAALADFLLSDQSGWITGQIMAVDGGRSTLRNRG